MNGMNYKQIEVEIRNLIQAMRNGKASLYEIAIRCQTLLNNLPDYIAQAGISQRDVLPRLNALLVDSNVSVETLLTVLKHRPNREQWTIGINKMLQEIQKEIDTTRRAQRKHEQPISVRRRVTLAEKEQWQKDLAQKEHELSKKDQVIAELQKKVATPVVNIPTKVTVTEPEELTALRDENKKLRTELKATRKELAEERAERKRLEKLLRRFGGDANAA